MIAAINTDSRYRAFLAAHPGIWGEVGAEDDRECVAVLLSERTALGLPPLPAPIAARLGITLLPPARASRASRTRKGYRL